MRTESALGVVISKRSSRNDITNVKILSYEGKARDGSNIRKITTCVFYGSAINTDPENDYAFIAREVMEVGDLVWVSGRPESILFSKPGKEPRVIEKIHVNRFNIVNYKEMYSEAMKLNNMNG